MRGAYLHNIVLVDRIAQLLRSRGVTVHTEHYLGPGVGFADLLAQRNGVRVLIEVERTPARVPGDIAKAIAVHAPLLFIVTPDARIARACSRRVARLGPLPSSLVVHVFPFGPALLKLQEVFP